MVGAKSRRGSTPDTSAGRGLGRAISILFALVLAVTARVVNSRVSQPYMVSTIPPHAQTELTEL